MHDVTLDTLAAAQSDEALRTALSGAGIVVWDLDLASGRVARSGSSLEVLGIASGDREQFLRLVHVDDRAHVDAALAAAFAGPLPYDVEFRMTTRSGGVCWVRERGEVHRDADGKPVRLTGVTIDITDSKQVQHEIATLRDRLGLELRGMARLRELGQHLAAADEITGLVDEILDDTVIVTGCDMGTLQLYDPQNDRLTLVSSRGFAAPFLDALRDAEAQRATDSAPASRRHDRVIVEDVTTAKLPAGTPGLDVLLEAGVRAMQSTPLLSRSGRIWGKVCTYRHLPTPAADWELKLFDLLCGQIADFIERAEAERARRESEENFRLLADATPDLIWTADSEGRLTFANDRWLRYSGRDLQFETPLWPAELLHPDDRERCLASWTHAIETGSDYEIEVRRRRHDGVYRWFLTRATPVRDTQGRVKAWFGASTDIEDRRRMEEALRDSESRLKMAIDGGDIGIWRFDVARGSATVSEHLAEMLGLPPDRTELSAEEWRAVIHPEDRAPLHAALENAAAEGTGFALEFRVLHDDGGQRWLMAKGSAETGPVPNVPAPAVAGISLDVTERKAAEERQDLLMAELDHRVRNILATIQAMIGLTGRNAVSTAGYAAALRGRVAAMANAHSLLTQRQWRGADLADIVASEMGAYAEAVEIRGRAGCVLKAKQALDFAMALHELATNASKYGALSVPAGRVIIDWAVEHADPRKDAENDDARAPRARFVWQETGGPPVARRETRGFGSRLIESALPGAVLSFEPGGLRCEVRLKVREQRRVAEAEAAAGPHRAARGGVVTPLPRLTGRHVLLVEDEPLVALELRAALEAAGAEILVASSLAAAQRCTEVPFAAAVLDVNLGDGMVFPVAHALMARGVPFVFATGYQMPPVMPADLRQVPIVQKPVESGRLVRLLDDLLRAL